VINKLYTYTLYWRLRLNWDFYIYNK